MEPIGVVIQTTPNNRFWGKKLSVKSTLRDKTGNIYLFDITKAFGHVTNKHGVLACITPNKYPYLCAFVGAFERFRPSGCHCPCWAKASEQIEDERPPNDT